MKDTLLRQVRRVRDVRRGLRPQGKISEAEWEDIVNRFNYASKVVEQQSPILALLESDLEKAKQIVTENRIHDVQEVKTITKGLKKIFMTPREEQLNELVGQIKYLKGFLAEMHSWVDRKVELERLAGEGLIEIERA